MESTCEDQRLQPWKALIAESSGTQTLMDGDDMMEETNAFRKGEAIVIGGQGKDVEQNGEKGGQGSKGDKGGKSRVMYDTERGVKTRQSPRQ